MWKGRKFWATAWGKRTRQSLLLEVLNREGVRLAGRQPVLLDDWPLPRLLAGFYEKGCTPPVGLSHEELFLSFLDLCEEESEVPVPRKATRKSKRAPAADASSAKQPRAGSSAGPVGSQSGLVLEALVDLWGTLASMDARRLLLEGARAPGAAFTSPPRIRLAAQAILPSFTLASALPVAVAGASFLSPSAALPDGLRESILAGKDVNLVKILLCGPESLGSLVVECDDVAVVLRDADPRLTKTLTLAEFVVAFAVFRDIICEEFPERRTRYLPGRHRRPRAVVRGRPVL